MCKNNVVSSQGFFVALSLVLLTVYVGYLFAANPNPPFPTSSSNSDTKTGSYTDDGTTVNVKAYVAYNYFWNDLTEEYEIRTYHFARLWGLPEDAQDFTVEFRHRPFDLGFLAGSAPAIPFFSDHVNDGEHGDQNSSPSIWERDETYTSYRDGDDVFEWDDIYTAVRFDGSTRAHATKPFMLPSAP